MQEQWRGISAGELCMQKRTPAAMDGSSILVPHVQIQSLLSFAFASGYVCSFSKTADFLIPDPLSRCKNTALSPPQEFCWRNIVNSSWSGGGLTEEA